MKDSSAFQIAIGDSFMFGRAIRDSLVCGRGLREFFMWERGIGDRICISFAFSLNMLDLRSVNSLVIIEPTPLRMFWTSPLVDVKSPVTAFNSSFMDLTSSLNSCNMLSLSLLCMTVEWCSIWDPASHQWQYNIKYADDRMMQFQW